MKQFNTRKAALAAASAIAISMAVAGAAAAQNATTTLRGSVSQGQTAEPGATVVATEVSTGYATRSRVGSDGRYVLSGLRPGTYRVQVTSANGQTAEQTVTLSLGQVGTLNLDVGSTAATNGSTTNATDLGDVVVTGRRVFEVRTPEVATNVTQQQINNLPQISRNFLNFAALAPGMRVTEDDTERTISAGGQTAQAINVFIDGQNRKSLINDGGVAGQDDSRGTPFPQGAVQEFRVISQNFKAEYEQAGSAIITAVTRSGTNEFHGDVFAFYQDPSWIAQDEISRRRGSEKAPLKRLQYGASLGGPILQDRLHFFGAYERKDEDRISQSFLNRTEYNDFFVGDLGTTSTPYEQDVFFGKLSWQIDDRQRLEFSTEYKKEEDIRGASGQNAPSRAARNNGETLAFNLRHQFQAQHFLNEFSIDYLKSSYEQSVINGSDYGRQYVIFRDNDADAPGFQYNINNRDSTVFTAGGRADAQFLEQKSTTIRNDLTIPDLSWMGTHTIKMGAKYSMQNYFVQKDFGRNPTFVYDIEARPEINGSRTIPVAVNLGVAVPPADVDNNVIGLYIQDDWQITDKLEINLGIRWDYEDNAVNNDYRTPDSIRNMLMAIQNLPNYNFPSYFNPSDYISDGDRKAFKGAFQPRFGFSYDVFGDEQTVIFGGAGRYYDRIGFNFAFDERFKPFQFNKTIYFSNAGGPYGGQDTIAWDPKYLTPAGLDPLLAASPGAGEVFLVKNNFEPPRTDQFNIGVRQKFGRWQTALTFAAGHTEGESAWYIANALTETGGRFDGPSPTSVGFSQFRNAIFFQNTDKERDYKAIYFTADKPYNREDRWGFNLAYTYMDATQNGSRDNGYGAFDFDYNTPGQSPKYRSSTDERHRIVASGTLGLPADFLLSGIVTLGSGLPYNIYDCPNAPAGGPNICWNGGNPEKHAFFPGMNFAYRQVDLRLTKAFEVFGGQRVELIADAINIFNFTNYKSFDAGYNSPRYGAGTEVFMPTQSFQVGLRYSF
ncbi:TonB-dependent receptor [Brevundimonas nasdae]|uniref:TonB-dependent receptor n=2 Tax=Brevundimonas nasdae TaxID=172043 RepID=A0ABX8TPX2_9CAUL|nr:TonB-dependent receptor [Brevundimonas nasdae]QYC12135.1 TonB-dependent receptor [Brevundimonas nasdae]QYC14055.1 TonB-dependent receptor [Brevundimonas nasdae]